MTSSRTAWVLGLLAWVRVANAQGAAAEAEEGFVDLDWSARVMTGYEVWRERRSPAQNGLERTEYGFFLDQARLQLEAERNWASAELSVELADAVRPDTGDEEGRAPSYLRDAYLGARFTKALRLRVGHYKRPFSRLELESKRKLPTRERGLTNSLLVEEARFGDRGLGAMLWGKPGGKLTYHIAISNPDWTKDVDQEANGFVANARIAWRPVDGLQLGGSYGHRAALSGADDHAFAGGVDAEIDVGALEVLVDAMLGELPRVVFDLPGEPAPLAYGAVVVVSYDAAIGGDWMLQPMLFGEYADANGDLSRSEAVRAAGGLNLVWNDTLRVMPQVEIVRSLKAASADSPWIDGERYFVMTTIDL